MIYITKKDNHTFLDGFTFRRPVYITLGFNDYVKFGLDAEKSKERMQRNHKHFFNELHRNVYKKSNKKIARYVVIERGDLKRKKRRNNNTGGFHTHIICETPEHLSKNKFENMLNDSWKKTKDGVSLFLVEDIYDKTRLDGYNAKQQSQKYTDAEIDFMNCHNIRQSKMELQGCVQH